MYLPVKDGLKILAFIVVAALIIYVLVVAFD